MEFKVEIKIDESLARDIELKILKSAETLRTEGITYLLEHIPYVTGNMLRSITWQTSIEENIIHTEIYSDHNKIKKAVYYPMIVEIGGPPHYVPLEVLRRWAELKYGLRGKDAYSLAKRVQTGILKKGNIAYYHFRNTAEYLAKNCEGIIDGVFRNT